MNFHDFHHWREDGQAPETVFRLRVGGALSTYGVSVPLEVWQSADERLVLAVTCDGVSEEREGARVCGLAMAPSPMVDDGGMAAEVTSLSFEFSQHALSQVMEKWQLMQLVKAGGNVYHLLVNAGRRYMCWCFTCGKDVAGLR